MIDALPEPFATIYPPYEPTNDARHVRELVEMHRWADGEPWVYL